ncbi:MAG: glutathione S-transferase family protein [Alphaproteobacteria bacterium]|jgi:glutathione S-transferase
MVTLYYSPGSCALASHLALEEAGADYETVRINFVAEEQRKPDYLAVNPKGRVPALVTDRGILTETPAILLYIAQINPQAGLAPLGDPFDLARLQSFNNYICATVHVAHAHRGRGHRWADDQAAIEAMQRKVPESVGACFALIESDMFEGPWVMGETYTICDPYFYTVSRWLEGDKVDMAKLPKTAAHMKAMEARPAVKKVLENHFS